MKVKTNERFHLLSYQGQWQFGDDPPSFYRAVSAKLTLHLVDNVVYGDNYPDWRVRIGLGRECTTTLVGHRLTIKARPDGLYSYRSKNFPGFGSRQGSWIGNLVLGLSAPVASESTDSTAEQQCQKRLVASYTKASQTWSGGKFLAEVEESIQAVLHPCTSMYKHTWDFAGKVKRIGRVYSRRPKTAAKALSDAWLAFSFGVKPLVQDANDATRALNVISSSSRDVQRPIKGFGHVVSRTVSDVATSLSTGGNSLRTNIVTTTEMSVSIKGTIIQRPAGMGALLDEFGVGVFDVLPSVWEGIPWSFFVDYFTNVGDMLDAMRLIQANQGWLKRTVRNRTSTTWTPYIKAQVPPSDTFYESVSGGVVQLQDTYTNRRPASLVFDGIPSFQLHSPGGDPRRLLNIVALVGQINDSHWGSSVPIPLTR